MTAHTVIDSKHSHLQHATVNDGTQSFTARTQSMTAQSFTAHTKSQQQSLYIVYNSE